MIGALVNDRYRLDAEAGRGGMGVVYRAYDTLLERDVAVKVLSSQVLSAENRERLLQEARAAARLNHNNLVSVYDAGEAVLPAHESPVPFVVMEWVEGPSLDRHRPSNLEEILAIAGQVCAALECAHAHGIVHRDLKPENVLLATDPLAKAACTAKLSDFGLARSMASRLTSEGTVAGTVFYLAPELAMGKEFDGRADLYALGVMLYELVTGELPFLASDPIAVISQHLYAPPVPPRAKKPEIPAGLNELIVRLLSKRPADRPASAGEVGAVLAALASQLAEPEPLPLAAPGPSTLARLARGRLVAREQEMAQARALWRRAMAGEGQMLLISGEPGIGKTRLVRELLTQVQVGGGWALTGECYAEGGAPYAPLAQIVGQAFERDGGPGLGLPGPVLADLLTLAPALRFAVGDVLPNPHLDGKAEQQRLFESVVALCAALCERAPALLVVEDAHWADSGSLALLRHLGRRTRRQPLLIAVTYREIEIDATGPFGQFLVDLNRERLATRLKLSRLDLEGTRDLLATLFAEEITPDFLKGIYGETEGNPFFVEEVCNALVESGELTFAGGRWHRPSMDRIGIPQSVRMAIQARVGRLPAAVQQALQLAAVLGREFRFQVLAGASDLDEDSLIEALEVAERAQLIAEVAGPKDVRFAFVHGLISASLADEVPTLRRRRLHRRAAEALERLDSDDVEALVRHWVAAGDDERALGYLVQAGEAALAAYANVEGERHFRAALELVQATGARAHLLLELGRALARQGRFSEAIEVWGEAIGLCREAGDREGVLELYTRSARAAWNAGDTPRGLAICREGMERAAGAPESVALADLVHETARAYYFNGLPAEAEALSRQALAMAERLGAVRVQAEALTTLGLLKLPPEEAVDALRQAIDLAEAAGLQAQASRAHCDLGAVLAFRLAELESARHHLLRAAELDRQRGDITWEWFARNVAILVALLQGDLALAEREMSQMRQAVEAVQESEMLANALHWTQGVLHFFRGEVKEAVDQLEAVRVQTRAAGDLQFLSQTFPYLIDSLLELGREAEAEAALEEAIDLEKTGLGTEWICPCQVAAYRARQGQPQAAQHLLSDVSRQMAGRPPDAMSALWLAWAQAHLAAAEHRWPEAWQAFEAAADGYSRAGIRWYRARVWQDWAGALLDRGQAGDEEQARDLLERADAELEAMRAGNA